MSWLFITAALGPSNFTEAAKRLSTQVEALGVFSNCVIIDLETIQDSWPSFSTFVPADDWCAEKNYGNFVWKPILARMALSGRFGSYEGVCYLDAGCEVLPSLFSRRAFKGLMTHAELMGMVAFSTGTPENQYTKSQLFERFELANRLDTSDQLAAGSWLSFGHSGRKIIERWASVAESDYSLINDVVDRKHEIKEFQFHRHDQSIFSLACKENNIQPFTKKPPGSANSFKSKVGNFLFAFRWARNRSGVSANPFWLRKFGELTLICPW